MECLFSKPDATRVKLKLLIDSDAERAKNSFAITLITEHFISEFFALYL